MASHWILSRTSRWTGPRICVAVNINRYRMSVSAISARPVSFVLDAKETS
jgi:hypothetical protein